MPFTLFKMYVVMVIEPRPILFATAGLSLVLCLALTPMAKRISLLDHPNEREVHHSPVPLVGGVAIYVSLVTAVLLATPYATEAIPLLAACGLMLITGMVAALNRKN